MTDEKDLEIARLRGQLDAAQAPRGSVVGGTFKVLGVLIAIAAVGLTVMVILGSRLPEGWRYEAECRSAAGDRAAEACMRDLEATYRGPDEAQYRRNAAEQWAADRGVRPAA